MEGPVHFDHIEVHVQDIDQYGEFLRRLFSGGRFRRISESGTSMFQSPDGLCIEVKRRSSAEGASRSGFCLPCIRTENARAHVETTLGLAVDEIVTNPEGEVFFFTDHEGIQWHVKDYLHRDRYINW